jgi:hypothetical protein
MCHSPSRTEFFLSSIEVPPADYGDTLEVSNSLRTYLRVSNLEDISTNSSHLQSFFNEYYQGM